MLQYSIGYHCALKKIYLQWEFWAPKHFCALRPLGIAPTTNWQMAAVARSNASSICDKRRSTSKDKNNSMQYYSKTLSLFTQYLKQISIDLLDNKKKCGFATQTCEFARICFILKSIAQRFCRSFPTVFFARWISDIFPRSNSSFKMA